MKHILITIAAVLLVGCGESQQSEPPTVKAPDMSIHVAAMTGNIEAVKQHLAAGAEVDAKDYDFGRTSLHIAAWQGHTEIIQLLIANGADVNAKGDGDVTPLDWAIQHKQTETADLIRKHGGKTGSELPLATLFEAVNQVDLQGVKDFLAKGADVNAKNHRGKTSLHIAAWQGHKEIAELLIAKGADVNAKSYGKTPLDYATNPDNPNDTAETADLLRKHGGKTGRELKAEGK